MNLPSQRLYAARRCPRGKTWSARYEECFAYDLKAFGGVGAPVIVSEGHNQGSGIWTVFLRKFNGTGLKHVVGSPEGTIEEARAYVEARIREGRYVRWTYEQQQRARGNQG